MTDIVTSQSVLAGAPRIGGTRIGVHHIAERVLDADNSPAEVAADYDLALADIYRALTYYYDHPEEMREVRRHRIRVDNDLQEITPPAQMSHGSPSNVSGRSED
jgi:uncharacterized protein (DUF433 family)